MEMYRYRETYFGNKTVPATTTHQELEALRATGNLTAPRVVEAAEPEESPLHPAFEWDNDAAANEYRLIQARQLIRAVVVVHESPEGQRSTPTSAYVHVPGANEREGQYVPLTLVTEREDEYARALAEAAKFLESAEERFRELRRVAGSMGGKAEALAIAAQGFSTVREALAILRSN